MAQNLHGAYIDRAINKIVAYLDIWMCCQNFTRDTGHGGWWVTHHRFKVKTFRSFRVQNKHSRISFWPREKKVNRVYLSKQLYQYLVRCLAPLSLTTMVIMASLFVFRRSLCTFTTSSIRMLLTKSPITKTKSPVTNPRVYMSRMASPGENVSFAVRIGTILIPEPGFDHRDSL